jgi:hypothetical protein
MSRASFLFGGAKVQKTSQKTKNVSENVIFPSKCLQDSWKSYTFAVGKKK